jgi:hypothetical protein
MHFWTYLIQPNKLVLQIKSFGGARFVVSTPSPGKCKCTAHVQFAAMMRYVTWMRVAFYIFKFRAAADPFRTRQDQFGLLSYFRSLNNSTPLSFGMCLRVVLVQAASGHRDQHSHSGEQIILQPKTRRRRAACRMGWETRKPHDPMLGSISQHHPCHKHCCSNCSGPTK